MDKIKGFLSSVGVALLFGPIRSIRAIVLGQRAVNSFRAPHGRDPDEQEWREIAARVEREVLR